jgi:uncharacterized protein
MSLERRTILKGGAAAAGGALLGGPFAGFVAAPAGAKRGDGRENVRLVPVRDKRDGEVRLHLPRGFSYRSFHDTDVPDPVNDPLTLPDGTVLPGRHDGMGAFRAPHGEVILVRNHEVNGPTPAFGPGKPYDTMGGGGTTTIRVSKQGRVHDAFTSLNGTMMNCSGGIMPWGSWVTCEETVNGPDVGADFTGVSNVPLQKPHGYVFEVPAGGQSEREPVTMAGRFAHEAVSFDPREGVLYLTEDNFGFPSGFYRYKPKRNPMRSGHLDNEGKLQMLAVKGERNAHLEGRQRRGATYDVRWVDIDEPDKMFPFTPGQPAPTANDTAINFVGDQGRAKGAAGFSRLEGQAFDDDVVYFTSTQGGGPEMTEPSDTTNGYGRGRGQVWGYNTRKRTLTCVYQSPGPKVLDFPDNVTVSPRGTIVVCEDGSNNNFVRGLARHGKLFDIALNRLKGLDGTKRFDDEFAGSTFSTDGHTLFVNIQASRGMTFAIWGPWRSIGV